MTGSGTTTLRDLVVDLRAEQRSLEGVTEKLDDRQWDLPTASPRWTVTDQMGHLRYFDRAAALAVCEPQAFKAAAMALREAGARGDESVDDLTLAGFRRLSPRERLDAWRDSRARLASALNGLEEGARVPWYGPSMGSKSFVTARLMEAWAHGHDVCEAVGARREPTDRLRHIAQLGYITRGWSYVNRGLQPPEGDVFVELGAPSGTVWTWGDPEAAAGERVRGPALDFCLVVTQRSSLADTALEVSGKLAGEWMAIAQAFAGPPTDGPAPKGSADRRTNTRKQP